ncbi:hypothetical protein Acr_27g0007510 [Actinidia rufa]|uniref:Uncharacterized protein n=1 Tax=Actinidia rufa TaxID=165716 RepID=A0A7J0H7E1_9ERIC|nr:hypothetical protein Acr_27g0007510 [Actinidia rufa]
MAKVGQPSSIQGDIEEMGETPEIVQGAAKMKSSTPSIVILKEESGSCRRKSGTVASVIFERPSVEMDGIPINRLLVDNASATNLISLSMMNKLGKTEKDLIASTASITDFAGGVTNSQGILIMNLKSRQTNGLFLPPLNHSEARLYNDEIGPIKIVGLDKLTADLVERKLGDLGEEELSALSADIIYEEDLPEQDVIQFEEWAGLNSIKEENSAKFNMASQLVEKAL